MTATTADLIGRTVNYAGDMANAPRTGYIADIVSDRWGTHAIIKWDDAEVATGWEDDGTPVKFHMPTTKISVREIAEEATARPGNRFRVAS